jgi:hypothetical protein
MFRTLLTSLKSYEEKFENWQPHHFVEAKSETLKKAVESSLLQEPMLEHFLSNGTEADVNTLVELLREEVPMMTVATLKGILDTLYKQEALQGTPSQELVRWYRQQGWKFPEFRFEKIEKEVTKRTVVDNLTQTQHAENVQSRDDSSSATKPGEGQAKDSLLV